MNANMYRYIVYIYIYIQIYTSTYTSCLRFTGEFPHFPTMKPRRVRSEALRSHLCPSAAGFRLEPITVFPKIDDLEEFGWDAVVEMVYISWKMNGATPMYWSIMAPETKPPFGSCAIYFCYGPWCIFLCSKKLILFGKLPRNFQTDWRKMKEESWWKELRTALNIHRNNF